MQNGAACCSESCGQCGGVGCGTIPGTGGSSNCCASTVLLEQNFCGNGVEAPCVIQNYTPAPAGVPGVAAPFGERARAGGRGGHGVEGGGGCTVYFTRQVVLRPWAFVSLQSLSGRNTSVFSRNQSEIALMCGGGRLAFFLASSLDPVNTFSTQRASFALVSIVEPPPAYGGLLQGGSFGHGQNSTKQQHLLAPTTQRCCVVTGSSLLGTCSGIIWVLPAWRLPSARGERSGRIRSRESSRPHNSCYNSTNIDCVHSLGYYLELLYNDTQGGVFRNKCPEI